MKSLSMGKQKLVILKIDGIGDYILFRNFLEEIRSYFSNYEITMIGNQLWKDLSHSYDSHLIDKFIWINIERFSSNWLYRKKVFFSIKRFRYDYLICPTFSRRFYFEDDLANKIKAKMKIGFEGDLSNLRSDQKMISDKFYDLLISVDPTFEFFKYRDFAEKITGRRPIVQHPTTRALSFNEKTRDIIIIPGGSHQHKKWAPENFGKLCALLSTLNFGSISICGSKDDKEVAKKIIKASRLTTVNDLTGKTTLNELVQLIQSASLLITNDTAASHIGPSVSTPTICLYKGDHYGRFHPYPDNFSSKYFIIMPPNIENLRNDKISKADINTIDVELVYRKAVYILKHI